MRSGVELALGAAGILAAFSTLKKRGSRANGYTFNDGSTQLEKEAFKRFQEAFKTFSLQPLIQFTPYQELIWKKETRIVCPHGLEEVLLIELNQEFGKMVKMVYPEGVEIGDLRGMAHRLLDPEPLDTRPPAFVYDLDDREHVETFLECGHPPGESAVPPSLRSLKPERNHLAPLGKDTPLYSFFPPSSFWNHEVERG